MIYERPWGTYEVLLDEPKYKVKRLVIEKDQSISLQYHNKRDEHWVVVSGRGKYILGKTEGPLFPGRFLLVPVKTIHRITAETQLTIIETQIGDCDENDIVRLNDKYGRSV